MRGRGGGRGAPPAKGNDEVATRVTLNYSLGNLGGKQPSWMTTGQAPPAAPNRPPVAPRKRGRPPKYPEEQTQVRQAPPTEPITRQPPSNSTSPQLANVLSHPPNGRLAPSPTTVLPSSPSPSEDAGPDYYTVPSTTAVRSDGFQNVAPEGVANGHVANASAVPKNAPPEELFLEGARQAATAPKRPRTAGQSPTLAAKRVRSSIDAHGRSIPSPIQTQTGGVEQTDKVRRISGGHMQSASPIVNQPFSPPIVQWTPTQSSFQQESVPHRVPSHPNGQLRSGPASPQIQNPIGPTRQSPLLGQFLAAKQSVPHSWPSELADVREQCLKIIPQFTSSTKIPPNDRNSPDSARIRALEIAADGWDWDYLMTHLFYCLLTLNKAALPEVVRNSPHSSAAEQFLKEVLDVNHKLVPAVQTFFTHFPMPVDQLLLRSPAQFRADVGHFTNLMTRSSAYHTLKGNCDLRNLPPLMHELVFDLGIRSKQLQQIVYTATIRRLRERWGLNAGMVDLEQQFEKDAQQIFHTMQNSFYGRKHQDLQRDEDIQRAKEAEMRTWIALFASLRESHATRFNQILRSMQANHQPPVLVQSPVLPSQHGPTRAPPYPQHRMQMLDHGNHPLVYPDPRVLQGHSNQGLVYPDPRMHLDSAQAAIHLGRGRPSGRPRLASNELRPQSQTQAQHHPRYHSHGQHHQQSQLQVHRDALSQMQMQAPAPPRPTPGPKPFFPPRGVLQPQQATPNPSRFGLHQAHLRSANLQSETKERLYLSVQSFLRKPQSLIEAGYKIETWSFDVSSEKFASIPKDIVDIKFGAPPTRIVDDKSSLLRLRCVKWTSPEAPSEHTWATSDTSWIPYSYFSLNGKSLEQRKKLHYGKDLPIDITHLIREGANTLDIAILRKPEDKKYRQYLVAIEVLGVQTHDKLMKKIQANNFIPAATIKQRIKEKLSPAVVDDDDIAFVNSSLTIKLTDPFVASKLCDIPTRGKACDHFDCFDLLTFLETRRRNGESDATLPDHWKCPICNGDARPQHLIVDGFHKEVQEDMEKQGLANVRSIVVSEDGSWKPKVEVLEGVADQDDEDVNMGMKPMNPQSKTVKVIDLGDSD